MEVVILNGYSRIPVRRRGHRRHRRHRLRQGPHAGRARRPASDEVVAPARAPAPLRARDQAVSPSCCGRCRPSSSTWPSSSTSTAAPPAWSRSRTSSRSWSARSSTSTTSRTHDVEPLPGGDVRVDARLSVDEANELLGARAARGRLGHGRRPVVLTCSATCRSRASRSRSTASGCRPTGCRAGAPDRIAGCDVSRLDGRGPIARRRRPRSATLPTRRR